MSVAPLPAPHPGPDPEIRARALLALLTPAEKLALLSGSTPFWSGMADIALRDASHRHPWPVGAVPRLGLGGLHFVDGPRGVVLCGGATTFPVPIARGASWDPELEERIGAAIAREARSFGADWVAAVCVNLLRHPGWGRAQETYGEDPLHVGAMGAAMTRGLERHAIACVKHFALNSIDSSRFLVDVQVSERVLHELYLPHFRDCVAAGAGSVMSAYNRVNGRWCGEHPGLLTEILKRRWGFTGLVVTDFIFGLHDGIAALRAGQDLEMPFQMILHGCAAEALARGDLPPERVDDAVLRQLRLQLRIPRGSYPAALRRCDAHRALAREAAVRSLVLLRNEPLAGGAPVLPLGDLRSLAVVGHLAAVANLGDRGSSDTRPEPGTVVTPLAGLRAARPDLAIDAIGDRIPSRAAARAARCEAVVVVVGLDWRHEGEHIHPGDIAPILGQTPPPQWLERWLGKRRLRPLWRPIAEGIAWLTGHAAAPLRGDFAAGDRTDLRLPPDQVALIRAVAAAQPRTVVVLMGGGAILCEEWRHWVPGLLLLWYPGEQGGHALADVLFGRESPSGRLPFTLPRSAEQLPTFEPRAPRVRYDLWHGYRRLQRRGEEAAYPFGFGLSYTHIELGAPEAALRQGPAEGRVRDGDQDPHDSPGWVQLTLSLHNRGARRGAEVVQVYLEPPAGGMERPVRALVAFQRVELAARERRPVSLAIPLRKLACFDPGRDGFVLEGGVHRLVVARHAEDPGLAVELDLAPVFIGP